MRSVSSSSVSAGGTRSGRFEPVLRRDDVEELVERLESDRAQHHADVVGRVRDVRHEVSVPIPVRGQVRRSSRRRLVGLRRWRASRDSPERRAVQWASSATFFS